MFYKYRCNESRSLDTYDGISTSSASNIWWNGDLIAENSQEQVLSIIINIFKHQSNFKKCFLSDTRIGHNSETLV